MPKTVCVVGVGGVGSWLALFLSEFKDVERIGLYDDDVVDESNLERTPFKRSHIGESKTEAMKELIEERRNDLIVQTYGNLAENNKGTLNMYDMQIASCDGVEPRNIVLEHENGISAGYDITEEKDNITVSEQGPIWSVGEEPDGYTIEPSWSVPAVLTATLTVYMIGRDLRPMNLTSCIKDHFTRGVNDHVKFHTEPQDESVESEESDDKEEEADSLGALF